MINDSALPGLFNLLSIVFTLVAFILGVVFMMTQLSQGLIMIMIAVAGGGIIFGIGRVLQLLNDIKAATLVASLEYQRNEQIKEVASTSEEVKESRSTEKVEKNEIEKDEIPYNVPVEWALTSKQRSNIMAYYLKDKQKVVDKDIIVTPFKGYCVVKTNHFIDVIEIVDDNPITLKRDQVDNFKELRTWIEENVFKKRKK